MTQPVEVRVYEGVYLPSGREIPSQKGVHQTEKDGSKWIGIKRAVLHEPLRKFVKTYIHEAGHHLTNAGDYSRNHADFGFDLAAGYITADLGKKD